ncbi:actin nucleation-promoting factor WASL-like [Monodelphis domestica]|uniref:actin nucleation-promoting factor WASL-like n=1 Tax=Monodelphis domestica TaxID=13616 RepID=UPI0024E1D141|nr:actin nucleation-promoting factor WASL-like [Monodelphis domestica]
MTVPGVGVRSAELLDGRPHSALTWGRAEHSTAWASLQGLPPPPRAQESRPPPPDPSRAFPREATSLPQSVSKRRPKAPDSSPVPERAEAPPQPPAPSLLPASPSSSEKARSLPSGRPAGLLEAAAAPCWMLSSLSEENPPASPEFRSPEGRRFPRGGGERPPAAGP